VVVENSPVVRAGVASMLDRNDDISVVGTADNPSRAHQLCSDLDVDVIVMNPAAVENAPDASAGRWFERLPDTRVVVLTDVIDEVLARAVSECDVTSCLHLTTVGDHELASAVRGVMHGRATFSSEFLPDLLQGGHQDLPLTHLTARENDILELLVRGDTNEAIAHTLGLATGTVRVYVSAILAKLGTPNRTAAAVLAIHEGLVARRTAAPALGRLPRLAGPSPSPSTSPKVASSRPTAVRHA
jgi:DNA-binding NarL/FixJ family response regulator